MTTKRKLVWWGYAPNRHVSQALDALHSEGLLHRARYGANHLLFSQLGTRQPAAPFEDVLPEGSDIRSLVRQDGAIHLINGFAGWLCKGVISACTKERARFFMISESLGLRHRWDPIRLLREKAYSRLIATAEGAFAHSRFAAIDYAKMGIPRRRIFPAIYAGPELPSVERPQSLGPLAFVGRLLSLKGVHHLLGALALLAERGGKIPLEIIGAGPEESRLRAIARARELDVTFRGELPSLDTMRLIAGFSAIVLPTVGREGWGYVVNEALASGVPVVVSDVVSARELVVPGRNGLIFPAGNEAALAEAIERVLAMHRDASSLSQAMAISRAALDARNFARYLYAIANAPRDSARVPAPWHTHLRELGAETEERWWREWVG